DDSPGEPRHPAPQRGGRDVDDAGPLARLARPALFRGSPGGGEREPSMIGEPHPRLGGERLVVGAGRFVEDVRVQGMLHAAVLRSPHAHARLLGVDGKRASELAGVRLVLTAADVPDAAIIPNRVPAPAGADRYLQPALARGGGPYVGEAPALRLAPHPPTARAALALVRVTDGTPAALTN